MEDTVQQSDSNLSPYHLEGSVWTHTMMVMTWVESYKFNEYYKKIMLISALLHDVGKCYTIEYNEEKDRYSFKGHEGVSLHFSIQFLQELLDENYIDENQIKIILHIISLHGTSIEQNEYQEYLSWFRDADKNGAVRSSTAKQDYDKRKFAIVNPSNRECIIMCGLPCVGKSTYISSSFPNHYILSRDNELTNFGSLIGIFGDYNTVYNIIHNDTDLLIRFNRHFNDIIRTVSRNEDKVVIDMTMTSLSSRRSMLQSFSNFDCKAIVMFANIDILKQRNTNRSAQGKHIPEHVLTNMSKSFVMPIKNEGFSDIKVIFNGKEI